MLLVLSAAVAVLLVQGPSRRSGPESVRGPRVLRARAASVRRLDVQVGPRAFAATRTPGGWDLDGTPARSGAAEALDALVETLAQLRALDAFRPRDRTALGLEPPAATIAVDAGGRPRRLRLGAPNAAGSALYAQRDGHPRVFLVGTALLSAIDRVFYQRDLAARSAAS